MSGAVTVWITRALPGAEATAARVAELGMTPVVAPLLAVRYLNANLDLSGIRALAFTSRHGVQGFARLSDARALPVYAVGRATADCARRTGFDDVTSADGDLSDLARLIRERRPGPILHPRAERPAGDLAEIIGDEVAVRSATVYATEADSTVDPPEAGVILIHSARAAQVLAARLTPTAVASRRIVAISASAARPLVDAGFTRIAIADRPDDAALMAALGKSVPAR